MPLRIQIQFFINIEIYPGIRLRRLYEVEVPSARIINISVGVNI
jgi:hypothetical protein